MHKKTILIMVLVVIVTNYFNYHYLAKRISYETHKEVVSLADKVTIECYETLSQTTVSSYLFRLDQLKNELELEKYGFKK